MQKPTGSSQVPSVNRNMVVQEVLTLCPNAYAIMAEYGLHCSSCAIGGKEILVDGCKMHGFDDEMIDALIEDLNDAIQEQPDRPAHIDVTREAAEALSAVAEQEGITECFLAIVMDGNGGFCMEFQDEPEKDSNMFAHDDFPKVNVAVSPTILWRIGGAKIDYRDKRFKLDLPEDGILGEGCGCKDGSCKKSGGCCA